MKRHHDEEMIRTQIQLEREQYEQLKRLAAQQGVSMARLVRDGVEAVVAARGRDRWEALFLVLGKYGSGKSPKDIGQDHDRYLDEIYGTWRQSS